MYMCMTSQTSSSFRLHARMDVLVIVFILTVPLVSSSNNQYTNGDLRLTGNGSSQLAGRLEIYHNRVWGTVCAQRSGSQLSEFNFRAATVACRQLGLGWAVEYYSPYFLYSERHRFGTPLNVALLDNVRCEGHEAHLLRCNTGALGSPSSECDPESAISITCSNLTTPYNGQVMLSHGSSLSQSSGVLRLYSNHQWGAVCYTEFSMNAAHAVCRQLGFTGAVLFREATSYSGPLWNMDSNSDCGSVANPQCFTDCLSQLPSELQSVSSCTPVEVSCSLSLADLSTHPGGNVTACQRTAQTPQNGAVCLNGCSSSQSTDINPQGRVEVFFDGTWGTVCDTSFLYKEADVVCKSLGFPSALSYGGQRYSGGGGSGGVFTVTCSGLEERVGDCIIERSDSCSHDHDVDVACSLTTPPYGALAIRSGRGAEGTLYIFTGEHMTPVCDHNFDLTVATVACRQLGYPGVVSVRPNGYYRGTDFPDVERNLYTISSCQGDEDYLLMCPSLTESVSHCRPGLDEVAIVCGNTTDSLKDVRLVEGVTSSSGRLEVRLNGEWGSVCSGRQGNRSGFSRLEAHVACQELEHKTVRDIQFISYSGPNALSQVSCSGFEESILDCKLEESTAERCTEVVALECTRDDLLNSDFHVMLVDRNDTGNTSSSGRLQITYRGLNMSMCGLLFTESVAEVLCRQLGFARMVEFCTNSCFGEGGGYIFLAETSCSGSERTLGDCDVEVHHSDMCDHSSDVGIVCEGTLVTTPSAEPPSPTIVTGFKSIYIYIIAGSSAGLVLVALVVLVVCFLCCCYVRHKRKQRTWRRSPNSTLTSNSRAGNSERTDHPKLNNYIQNDLTSEANSKATKQAAEATGADDFDDPTDALEMKEMQPNSSHNIRKGNLFEDEATTGHPSSLTIDSGYGVSNSNITYGPESPPPNYDELDLLPVATEFASATASGTSCTTKRENEGGFKNLSFRSKDGDTSAGEKN